MQVRVDMVINIGTLKVHFTTAIQYQGYVKSSGLQRFIPL
ncbi:hypothetical protein SAMN05428988_4461 [Chitinophaga sp. YR573]|nr:hypothetical protein SAMN05428988_4461 [Chitinophaga sp. YR573]